jgi:prepilin-type processing-associated H-X9-DG protein
MPIDFICPRCNASLSVPDEFAGQHGPCPSCEATVTIPLAEGAPFAQAVAPPVAGSSTKWLVVLAIMLAVFFLALLVVMGVVVATMMPTFNASQDAAMQLQCRRNLQQIGRAFQLYHDDHGCFPPAYLADENGRPMHSWRVLILPQLGEDAIYEQYNFDQPWDSPENRDLAQSMPDVYGCPSDWGTWSAETSYMMLVGPETISDGTGTTSLDEITDPKDRTIVLVETSGNLADWIEPTDLEVEGLTFRVNDPACEGIQSNHPGGAHVLFADGSIRFLPNSIGETDVEALSTIDENEQIDEIFSGSREP